MFKSNTRFASLIDENKTKPNNNNNTKPNNTNANNNTNKRSINDKRGNFQTKREERKQIIIPKIKIDILSETQFPQLTSHNKKEVSKSMQELTFLESLNINKKEDNIIEKCVEPGCVVISLDKKTNRSVFCYGEPTIIYKNIPDDTNDISIYKVYDALAELHEKRTNEYIELWGYDDYEKQFLFPNYDYDYFDKLDEAYDQEMRLLNKKDMNLDEDDDGEYL